jgi:F-type H+-transporting ATPase subunit delta
MKDLKIAKVWAQALLEIAQEKKKLDAVVEGVRLLDQLASEVPLLESFMASPNVPQETKKDRFAKALGKAVDPVLLDFCDLLVDRMRGMILTDVLTAFMELYREAVGVVVAVVRCAVPLADAEAQKIQKKLSKMYGLKVELDVHVDASILGGMTIYVGDTKFDGSLSRSLKEIKSRLLGARIDSEVVYAD